jgi:hypothetical protein
VVGADADEVPPGADEMVTDRRGLGADGRSCGLVLASPDRLAFRLVYLGRRLRRRR